MVMVRRSLPLRVLCLLLIACVLCCSCLMPYAQAVVIAPALTYGAIELIAAALIGGGAVYATSGDAREAAGQVFSWLQENAMDAANTFLNMAGGLIGAPELTGVGFRVSSDVWQSIADAFSSLFGSGGSLQFGKPYTFADLDDLRDNLASMINRNNVYDVGVRGFSCTRFDGAHYTVTLRLDVSATENNLYVVYTDDVGAHEYCVFSTFDTIGDYAIYADSSYNSDNIGPYIVPKLLVKVLEDEYLFSLQYSAFDFIRFYTGTYSFTGDAVVNDLVFPSDDYLVRVPDLPDVQTDEDGKEVVVYPDLSLNPTDHLADIPKQETGEQVDVPYDTLVDIGTGEAVGEDVENPDIPTEGTDTGLIQNILDKITNFFDSPSDFKLDFDGFKNLILPDRFPFCIPFDLINSVRVFAASAANFSFDIDLETSYFSVHHTVDLSPFAVPIAFFRYTCVLFWIWVLITRTRDLMKW